MNTERDPQFEEEMDRKIKGLISQMTLEEKASQMLHKSPAVERLGIPAYNWWNEALHGVARAGVATVFPQAIGMAASFDEDLLFRVASAISDEARAKFAAEGRYGTGRQYHGLTFWTPNINIFRDPRWGRGQETYGEDPVLTAALGSAFVRGLQGDDKRYLKTAACAKHYAVHSGPEALRHSFDAIVSPRDLHETYLPAFKALVDAGVEAFMGAYNRTLGEACCASDLLMGDILRTRWQFKGHYVSDCWAIRDFHTHHKLTSGPRESVALAVNAGCDLNCGCTYEFLVEAVKSGILSESKVDESLIRLFRARYRLGILGLDEDNPWSRAPEPAASVVRSPEHLELSLEAARRSLVLLKNDNNLLPLSPEAKRILLIGPGAANVHVLLGNYHGLSPRLVTILEGMSEKVAQNPRLSMDYHPGCGMYAPNKNTGWTVGMAEQADLVVAVFGLDSAMEGEEGDAIASDSKGDRDSIELPPWQLEYLRDLKSRGTPMVLILTGGSPIAVPEDIADAIIFAWYPGEQGGRAVADLLFGECNATGKLPVTFPKATADLPPYEDYAMAGRTYRYLTRAPLYPFGFGLSYSSFSISGLELSSASLGSGGRLSIGAWLENRGPMKGSEVLQLYVRRRAAGADEAFSSLRRFSRINLEPGSGIRAEFSLGSEDFMTVDRDGQSRLIPGDYELILGNCAPLSTGDFPGALPFLRAEIRIEEGASS